MKNLIDAEKSVLGACLLDPGAVDLSIERLTSKSFSQEIHRDIFAAIERLSEKHVAIDAVTIMKEIGMDSSPYLADLMDFVPTTANVKYYIDIVETGHQKQRLQRLALAIQACTNDDPKDLIAKIDSELMKIADQGKSTIINISEAIKHAAKALDKRGYLGVTTGAWPTFDKTLSGLCAKNLYVVAARPSVGKTAFALSLIQHIRVPTIIFSLEMGADELATRLCCSMGNVNMGSARTRSMSPEESSRWIEAASRLAGAEILIDDTSGLTMAQLRAKARMMKRTKDIGMVIVDYLQLMDGQGESRQQVISSISRGLKLLAKELNVPVVALSQLNRSVESRADKRPMLADLRESGAIEQDADVVMFLYRPSIYDNTLPDDEGEVIVEKNRNGRTGVISFRWAGEFCRWDERVDEKDFGEPVVEPGWHRKWEEGALP